MLSYGARRVGPDGPPDPADRRRADLRQFDGDARLGAAGARVPALARWLLGLGITAALAANVAHGLGTDEVAAYE